jgi:hypothetical protein
MATLNTDNSTKLYFLLGKSSTSFSEDNDRFRDFFENRYISLADGLQKKIPHILRETMEWLTGEVFVQQDDAEREEVDAEQYAFEEELGREIEEASEESRRRQMEVLADFRRETNGDGE